MESFMGQVMQVGFNFAPQYWSTCQGQIMNVSQNAALFSLLGTTFGGNGSSTFGLPDAQGRTFVGTGHGAGLAPYDWGEAGGSENVTLLATQMPAHIHPVGAPNMTASLQAIANNSPDKTTDTPEAGAQLGIVADSNGSGAPVIYVPAGVGGTAVNLGGMQISGNTGISGGNQPLPILQPFLAMTTIICLNGIYPTRS